VIDCTGSGDVDMAVVVKADAEGCIESVSGHKLEVNPGWTNPTGVGGERRHRCPGGSLAALTAITTL
jgi:hypothetical protein